MKFLTIILAAIEFVCILVGAITIIIAVRVAVDDCSEYKITHNVLPINLVKKESPNCGK